MADADCDHWYGMTEGDRQRLDALVGNLPGSIVYRLVTDPQNVASVVYVSPAIEENIGLTADDVRADITLWYDVIHPDDALEVLRAQQVAFDACAPFRVTTRYLLNDGQVKLFEIHASPERMDDGCVIWNGVATDITEAAALREERQRLLHLIDATTDFVCVVRADGTFESVNKAARDAFGLDELRGRRVADFFDADDMATLCAAAKDAGETSAAWTGVLTLRGPSGPIPFEQTIVGTRGRNGTVTHYASIGRDLSEAHASEAALRDANEQVEVALREVNHRIKNFFALVPALVKLSARTSSTTAALSEAVQARIGALSRSHTLTLNAFSGDQGIALRELIDAVLEPYTDATDAFILAGPDLRLSGRTGNAVALALHELATNAAKHGVFSAPGGHVRIEWDAPKSEGNEGVFVTWTEDGGPEVAGPPSHAGFGTSLLDRLIAAQGGELTREWRKEGLRVALSLPRT